MAKCNVDGTIGQAVATYSGGIVLELDVVAGPSVGEFAIQALIKYPRTAPCYAQFLVSGVLLQDIGADDLAEVEFTAWPPTVKV